MKKLSSILVLSIIVFLLGVLFTGCSIIGNLLGHIEEEDIQVPTNLKYNDGELSWNAVTGADSYEIRLVKEGESDIILKSDTEKVCIPSELFGSFTASVRAISNAKESPYSASITFTFGILTLDENTFSFDFDTFILSWEANSYAYSYNVTVKKGSKIIANKNVPVAYYTLDADAYDSNYRYVFEVVANSKSYTSSSAVSFTIQPKLDFSLAEDYVVDLSEDKENFVYYNPYANYIAIDDSDHSVELFVDYSSSCILTGEKMYIPRSIFEKLAYGTYRMIIGGDDFNVPYVLKVLDSRSPIVSADKERYIVENTSLTFSVESFAYSMKEINVDSLSLSSSDYSIEDSIITLYSSYLDELALGSHTLQTTFLSLFDGSEYNVKTQFIVTQDFMELVTTEYNYIKGENLSLDVKTNGDRVSRIIANGEELPTSCYYSGKNTLILFAEYLDSTTADTFLIESEIGGYPLFTINRNIKGFVSAKTYTYDKSGENLLLDGFLEDTTVKVYGNSITKDSFFTDSKGITLQGDYLSTLAVGSYTFLVECCDTFSYVTVDVINSSNQIENLQFDFDIEENEVYIRFECNCGKDRHYYCLDSGETVHSDRIQKLSDFSIDNKHSVKVSCSTYSTSSTISYEVPSSEERSYMKDYFSLKGDSYNKVIGSLEELSKVFEYLVYGGSGVEYSYNGTAYEYGCASETVYFTDSLISIMQENKNYFNEVSSAIDVPYSCAYSLKQVSSGSNVFSLLVSYPENIEKNQTSGMINEALSDDRVFLSEGDRSDDFDCFAINSFTKTEVITSTEELASLPYGVKPIFEGESEAKTIYENALDILRKYVSSNSTDVEKVTAIFHWIVSNVTYDYNTLALYNLSDYLQHTALSTIMAKDAINEVIENNSSLESLLSPATMLTGVDDIRSYIKKLNSKMRAFSLEGSLIDNIAVCDGISDAFKLLCLIEGIPATKVTGVGIQNGTSENHAWNKVQIGGSWYVVDATWGRASGYVSHKYFLVAEKDVVHDHIEGVMGTSNTTYSVVDILADGSYDYYANTILYGKDSLISDKDELKSILKAFIASDDNVLELKLEFDFSESQLLSLMKEVYKGTYRYRIDDVYLTLMM